MMNKVLRVAFLSLCLVLILSAGAFAASPITWTPGTLAVKIGSGIAQPVEVTFHSTRALHDVEFEVVPEIAPFISVTDPAVGSVEAGADHTVELSFYLPPNTPEGVYEGTLHLREGHRTLARPLPVVLTVDYGGAVLAPGARVLSRDAAGRVVGVSPDRRTLAFQGLDDELLGIRQGDVLVVPASDLLPSGFLGRVLSVAREGDQLTVTTEPAALTDAVQAADLDVHLALGADSVVQGPTATSQALRPKGLFEPIEVPLDAVLLDLDHDLETTDDQVRTVGAITLTPDVNLALSIADGQIDEFSITATASAHSELTVEAQIEASFERERELARYRFEPIVFWIGWLPVYIQPELSFSVGVSGQVAAHFSAGATADATVEAGVLYDGAQWSTTHDSSIDFAPIGPTLDASAQVEAKAGPTLSVLLYDAVGPQLDLTGYARLSAELGRCPYWWELTGGVSLDAAIDMGPFSDLLAGPSYPGLISYEKVLAHADDCGDESGSGSGGKPGERIFFSSDRLGDQDIWSMAPDGTDLRVVVDKPGLQANPAISPDGTKLAYADPSLKKVYVLDLTTGDETVLDGNAYTGHFEWTADGTAVIGSWPGCGNDIRRYPLSGGQYVVLNEAGRDTLRAVDWNTGKIFYTNDPCWSPYMRWKVYDPATGSRTVLKGDDGRAEDDGNISLDGQWLAYTKADYSYIGPTRIYVTSTAGGPETRVSTGTTDRSPHFSPHGDQIVFTRETNGKRSLWIINRDGSGERALLDDGFNNITPEWAVVRGGAGQ